MAATSDGPARRTRRGCVIAATGSARVALAATTSRAGAAAARLGPRDRAQAGLDGFDAGTLHGPGGRSVQRVDGAAHGRDMGRRGATAAAHDAGPGGDRQAG